MIRGLISAQDRWGPPSGIACGEEILTVHLLQS